MRQRQRLSCVGLLVALTCNLQPAFGGEGATPNPVAATVEDVIPITIGNLRGHRSLYREGWFVVTSSEKALAYAREHAIVASREAIAEAAKSAAGRATGLPEQLGNDISAGVTTAGKVLDAGTEGTKSILRGTRRLTDAELAFARKNFDAAASRFVKGNLTLKHRTADERRELASLPGRYFEKLGGDFGNIGELADAANRTFAGNIEVGWSKAFDRAREEFRREYERSGEQGNTLKGLGPILYGYLKSAWYGLVAPGGRAAAKGASTVATQGVFRPTAYATMVAGRTIEATGLSLYYTGKAGIEIVSPTVEAGLLGGLSLLSLSTVPVTSVTGAGIGAVNQVAFTAAAPVAGTAQAAGTTIADTAKTVGLVTFDAARGVTRVVINQAQSGVVLGYNALTAIPTHLLMGVADAAIFLAWDGPRLVVAVARGDIGGIDRAANGNEDLPLPSVGDLPVGTVADLDKLRQSPGITVEILSEDPKVIGDVLRRLPCDLRTNKETPCAP